VPFQLKCDGFWSHPRSNATTISAAFDCHFVKHQISQQNCNTKPSSRLYRFLNLLTLFMLLITFTVILFTLITTQEYNPAIVTTLLLPHPSIPEQG